MHLIKCELLYINTNVSWLHTPLREFITVCNLCIKIHFETLNNILIYSQHQSVEPADLRGISN